MMITRCDCTAADKCPNGKVGIEDRCVIWRDPLVAARKAFTDCQRISRARTAEQNRIIGLIESALYSTPDGPVADMLVAMAHDVLEGKSP